MDKWKIETDIEDNGRHLSGHIIKSIKERFVKHSISAGNLTGIGIGVPGFVDEASTFFVTLGTGVGSGIIVNGDLVNGPNGTAGEIDHTITVPHGRLCTCGREGCLEEYVAAKGLRRSLRDYLRNFRDSSPLHKDSEVIDIYEAAKAGDALAVHIVNDAAYYLAYALANVVTLINPEKIIIGGGVSAAGEKLLRPLVAHFKRFVLKEADKSLSFEFARPGNDAGIYGATWLVMKRLGYFQNML
ncbi:ROK family protein [Salicibibacter halophilus]|uniref:ROK family protein n=2 Tax=Salicibibacter halophilus TaxID=2502791 RepID=A0A514LH87_9BACI|nr:ROK family protein [Salicibibacter halophilus]